MPDRTKLDFGPALQELLSQRGMSLRALADRIGIGHSYLSRVSRGSEGRRPGPDLIRRVARALGVRPDYFWEFRAEAVIAWLRETPEVVDDLYDQFYGKRPPAPRRGRK